MCFVEILGWKMSLNDVLALRRQAGGVIGKFQVTTLDEVTLGMHTIIQ